MERNKEKRDNLKLHLVGGLQSNKAKKAAEIFDYIHSLDSQKLADILSKTEKNLNKSITTLYKLILVMKFKNREYHMMKLMPFIIIALKRNKWIY